MPILKRRHEVFCQLICTNCAPPEAYVKAGFSGKGAHASASRLLQKANICSRIAELQQAVSKVFVVGEIANRTYRVAVLQDVLGRMVRLMDARASDLAGVPGGNTGLLVRELKSFGSGKDRQIREEYRFDAALVQQMRETTKEAAIEMGQRSEKQEFTLTPAAPTMDYSRLSEEQIQAALEKMKEARAMLTLEAVPGTFEELSPTRILLTPTTRAT